MPIRLTETAIGKATRDVAEAGNRRDLADAGCTGLRLRITPAGARTWVLACRDRMGRMRRFTIGTFPGLGISEARDEARALHGRVKYEGADPTAERRRDRALGGAAKAGIGTLKAILDGYGDKRGRELKSWPESRKRVELVFKPLLSRPVSTLTVGDLQVQADGYAFPKSAAFAVRTVRPALKWAAVPGRGYAAASLADLRPPATVERRKRVLQRDELAAVLPALRHSARPHAAALRFMLMTLARREEVACARWRDIAITSRTWTIPETKNGEPHVVPLSLQALALLTEVKVAQPKRPPRKVAAPAQADSGTEWVFHTGTGAKLGNWDRETKAIQIASKVDGWTRHDLRRTAATMLGEMGELPDIIEAALNHVSIRSSLAATYNRSRYRPQVAAALQRLADALDGIEAGAAKVVPLRAGS